MLGKLQRDDSGVHGLGDCLFFTKGAAQSGGLWPWDGAEGGVVAFPKGGKKFLRGGAWGDGVFMARKGRLCRRDGLSVQI
jgi:hypothetical protein